jgi:hypothetical protein
MMNERIVELAEKAGMVMYPTGLGIKENTLWGDRNIEKFAELIIAQCLEQAEAVANDDENSDSERMGAEYVITNIINAFGVK